jgi:hypothetical protein
MPSCHRVTQPQSRPQLQSSSGLTGLSAHASAQALMRYDTYGGDGLVPPNMEIAAENVRRISLDVPIPLCHLYAFLHGLARLPTLLTRRG